MPQLQLTKSVDIAAPPEKLFPILSQLGSFLPWNPWLATDPEARVEVTPDGKSYTWAGKRTGEGEMRITDEVPGQSVDIALRFLKPFKSKAKVRFTIASQGEGSRVSWSMDSSMPFFMFFFMDAMRNMIGMDYQRGLNMLRDYAETGRVPSVVHETGPSRFVGGPYVGITTETSLSDLAEVMTRDFSRINAYLAERGITAPGPAFSIYEKWNMSKASAVYTAGVILSKPIDPSAAGLESGTIPELSTYVLTHRGPYRHLGNAWSTGMQMARCKEFVQSKKHKPFEVYPVDAEGRVPGGDSNELTETQIHFPLR